MASTEELIIVAVQRVREAAPALANLRLVFGLDLTTAALTGPEAVEAYRVELPGPKVSEGEPDDARITLAIPKTMFNVLAEDGELADWREALQYGHLKVGGDARVKKLLGRAIEPAL
jgi:hypothetical protein